MTPTEATLLAALLASPFLYSVFDWLRNKINARFIYRGWQAVFLKNEHTYFGKITSANSNGISLKEIYYIDNPDDSAVPQKRLRKNDDFELTKLGETEVHSPRDHMIINRSEIMFRESLQNSGLVVQKILEHQKSKL